MVGCYSARWEKKQTGLTGFDIIIRSGEMGAIHGRAVIITAGFCCSNHAVRLTSKRAGTQKYTQTHTHSLPSFPLH